MYKKLKLLWKKKLLRNEIENRYKNLKRTFFGTISLLVICIITFAFTNTETFGVIRAKGIIIIDEKGKERILIGAPIPFSKDRVRDDTAMVRKYFANTIIPKNPDLYMKYYKEYKNSAFGMVVLNDKGIDVVQFGDKLLDPNTGRRQFENSGLIWNAQNGTEKKKIIETLEKSSDTNEKLIAQYMKDTTR